MAKISVFVIVKSARRIPARGAAYQRASSVHRFARRFAALTDVAPTIGCGRVRRKFQPSQARRAVLPGPAQDFAAIRGVCGKASSASRCQGSGLSVQVLDHRLRLRFLAMRVSSDRSRSRLIAIFHEVRDPRDFNARHDLAAMLFIALAATLCGAKTFVDIADFAAAIEAELAQIVDLPHGAPSHDSFSRLFRLLDPEEMTEAFARFQTLS